VVEVAERLLPNRHDFGGKAAVGERHAREPARLQNPVNFLKGLSCCTHIVRFRTSGRRQGRGREEMSLNADQLGFPSATYVASTTTYSTNLTKTCQQHESTSSGFVK
jgi:hypothetical protein